MAALSAPIVGSAPKSSTSAGDQSNDACILRDRIRIMAHRRRLGTGPRHDTSTAGPSALSGRSLGITSKDQAMGGRNAGPGRSLEKDTTRSGTSLIRAALTRIDGVDGGNAT